MGRIIAKRVKGMNWMAKISLVLIFTLVFSTFMYQGWYKPKPAAAAITSQAAWSNLYAGTSLTPSASYTVATGSQRMLVVGVVSGITAAATQTCTVTYGGVSMTIQGNTGTTSGQAHSYLFYLKDTPSVMNGSAQTLAVTLTGGTASYTFVSAAVYAGVDQSASPITNAQTFNGTVASPMTFPTALTVNANDQAVQVGILIRTGGTYARTLTSAANWTQPTGIATTYTDTTNTMTDNLFVQERSIPGTNTTDNGIGTPSNATTTVGSVSGMSMKQYVAPSDTTPPVTGAVTVSPDSASTYTSSAPTITATLTDPDSPVTACEYTTNGTTWVAGTVSGASSPWTCTGNPTGLTGSLTINVRGTSAGGTNTAGGTAITRTVDATAPTDGTLTVTPGNAQNSLSWSGFSDAASGLASTGTYILRFATGATAPANCTSGTAVTGSPFSSATTSTTHTVLTNGTQYSYRLCAVDAVNNTSTGATGSGTPQACTDPDPAVLTITNPVSSSTISGTVTVQMSVGVETTPATMTTVEFQINGTWRTATWNGLTSLWEYSWNTKLDYPGTGTAIPVTINAHGTDIDCNTVKTASVSFNVNNPVTLSANITSCAGCHGYTSAFPDGTARNTPAGEFPGSHDKHVVQYGKVCSTCHTAPATETSADYGHRNGTVDIATTINGAGTYSKTSFVQSNGAFAPGNCSNTYCHSNGTSATTPAGSIPTNTSPSWGGTAACNSCHAVGGAADGRPNYPDGTPKANKHQATTHAAQTCDVCHDSVTYSAGTYTPDPTKHNNGVYNLNASLGYTPGTAAAGGTCATPSCHGSVSWGGTLGCVDCHSSVQTGTHGTPRDAVAAEFGNSWGHKKSGRTPVADSDCIVCHLEGKYSGAVGTAIVKTTYHMDGNIDLRDPDGAGETPITDNSGAAFTFTKYSISYGAGSRTTTLGNTVAEVITVKFCMKCHDSNGATNPTARSNNGGTGTEYMPFGGVNLGANYTPSNGQANGTGAPASGGLIDVATQFASTNSSRHPVGAPNLRMFPYSTRLLDPYKPGTGRDSNTQVLNGTGTRTAANSVVLVCDDCHTIDTTVTNRTFTAHGVPSTATTGLRGTYFVTGPTLCLTCHIAGTNGAYNNTSTTAPGGTHGAGSGFGSGPTRPAAAMNLCNFCHFSQNSTYAASGRPRYAQDVHGFNEIYGTTAGWTAGNANGMRPVAFMRSAASSGGSWAAANSPRPYTATTTGPGQANIAAAQAICSGNMSFSTGTTGFSCGSQNHSSYGPGGSY